MDQHDEFFVPDDVDQQIEQIRQSKAGDQRDAEALAYLRSYYQADAQHEQEILNRVWQRIADTPLLAQNSQKSEKGRFMDHSDMPRAAGTMNSVSQTRARRSSLAQRLSLWAAVIVLVALVGGLALAFYATRLNTPGSHPPSPISTNHAALHVDAVSMSVTPNSLNGLACGSNVTVTYTALFHVNQHSAGGTVRFTYTTNNGRSQTPASITLKPGETSKTYSFTWSGALPVDHTYPGLGGVQVSSPNQLTSPTIKPTGQCGATALEITKVTMAVSPASLQGLACGSSLTVTYTATIDAAPNNSGGTVRFSYTTNNGRSQTPASVTFNPGQTTKTYSFTWSGVLPADHTAPGLGGIQITSPNQLTSGTIEPTGQCGSSSSSAFRVTSVTMAASPASLQGTTCGTSTTVTYTATIHVAANGPGGTVQFTYTVNNGRSQTPASVTFAPGQTTKTYSFTWSGALPADHTYPGLGGIQITSPNALTSSTAKPAGQCG